VVVVLGGFFDVAAVGQQKTGHRVDDARLVLAGQGQNVRCIHDAPIVAIEALQPGHQRGVVVGAEVVQVLDHELALGGRAQLAGRGQLAIGKDVSGDPGVGGGAGAVLAYGVQQEQAILAQAAACHPEVVLVVAMAHMLEHADRGDAVEALPPVRVELAVVGQLDAHRQSLQPLLCPAGLFARDGQADAAHAVMLGGMTHQPAPAAADVEQGHAGAQLQLAADQIELGQLRLFQRGAVAPVAAAVGHGRVEHGLEQ
jgi:hypothetical protein